MIRKLITGVVVGGIGYLAGVLFGYRAAVVDYVENDAKTIQSMAETMYDTRKLHELVGEDEQDGAEALQNLLEASNVEDDEESEERGFQ
jgi:uncharacterized protein YpuA (DUF1002 family)